MLIIFTYLSIRMEPLFAATAACIYFSLERKVTKVQGFMIFAKKSAPPAMKWSRSFHFTSSLHFLSVPPPIFLNAHLMRPFRHPTVHRACAITQEYYRRKSCTIRSKARKWPRSVEAAIGSWHALEQCFAQLTGK